MRKNSLAGQVLSFVVSALIVLAGVLGFRALIYKPDVQASPKVEPTAPLVHTVAILSHKGSLDITVDGLVTPFREIEVAAEVAGKVVFKDETCNGGCFVTRGTRLIKIDPQDYELAVRRLENQLEQADANIEELQVEISNSAELIKLAEDTVQLEQNEVNRLAGLIQARIVTDSTLDRAKQTELSARNTLAVLKNQLQLLNSRQRGVQSARDLVVTDLEKANLDLTRTEIVAAVDGVIIKDLVERDSFVQKGDPLFMLEDTSAVEVKCRLKMEELYWIWRQSGHDVNGVSGSGAGYQIPDIPVTIRYQLAERTKTEYEWQGVLARFDGIGLDDATRTVPCRVLVDKPRDVKVVSHRNDASAEAGQVATAGLGLPALVRGLYVKVTFHVNQSSPLLLIPEPAVQPGKTLWIVKDGHLEQKSELELIELIEVEDANGSMQSHWLVEAATIGLAAGERVVVPPFGVLRNQEAVREEVSP